MVLAGCGGTPRSELPAWSGDTGRAIAEEAGRFLAATGASELSVAVMLGDSVVFARVLGAPGDSATTGTRFPIGEIERQFTAAAVVALAERGGLALDEPLPPALVGAGADETTPTMSDLLHQVSGLSAPDSSGVVRPFERPRLRWTESRVHIDLARALMVEKSGRTYEESVRALAEAARLSTLEISAPGLLSATPSDLVRWSRALETGAVIPRKGHEEMISLVPLRDERSWPYGMGLELQTFEDRVKVMHAGATDRSTAVLARYPKDDLSVAIMTSQPDAWTLPALERRIARRIFGIEDRVPPEKPIRESDIARVTGEYECGALSFELGPERGAMQLTVRSSERGSAPRMLARLPLRFIGEGRFVGAEDADAVHAWFKRGPGPVPELVVGWFGLPCQAVRRGGPAPPE